MSYWASGAVALVAFQPSGDVAEWQYSLSWSDYQVARPVQSRRTYQGELLSSGHCGLGGVLA